VKHHTLKEMFNHAVPERTDNGHYLE